MELSALSDRLSGGQRLLLAFSGGLDSVCLLHLALKALGPSQLQKLACLHIDHSLDADSAQRAQQAVDLAASFGVACEVHTLTQAPKTNREAWAREQRYKALKAHMQSNDVVVTAHHANDVAENLMLRMLRGSGLMGLSGIQEEQPFGLGLLWRPMLQWSKEELRDYATRHALHWIDDPSNACLDYDRNFIRHEVLPILKQQFPGVIKALNRSAKINRQAASLLESELAARLSARLASHQRMNLTGLASLDGFELAELIRRFCLHHRVRPPPGESLDAFVYQIQSAQSDRLPELRWEGHTLYRYHHHLWLVQAPTQVEMVPFEILWSAEAPLTLPGTLGTLELIHQLIEPRLQRMLADHALVVSSGQPGERIQMSATGPLRTVSKLLSQAHIPPWERPYWPRVWLNGELLACGARWQHPALGQALQWHSAFFGNSEDQ